MNNQLFKLCLEDYSAAAFTSFDKEYFGTFEMIESFIDAIKYDKQISEKFADLTSTFDKYKSGAKNVTHNVAYKEVPFLERVKCLGQTNSLLMNYKWEHLNTWRWPYNMMFKTAQSEHLWLSFNKKYARCIKQYLPICYMKIVQVNILLPVCCGASRTK